MLASTLVYAGAVDWFFDEDGVVDPSSYHQRNRRTEFDANKPFFQWWYYTIKDLDANNYFTFHYNLVYPSNNQENEGFFVGFSIVNQSTKENWHIYEKYSLNEYHDDGYYNSSLIHDSETLFSFNESENGKYHLYGEMKNTEKVWKSINCSDDTYIKWDITLHRIYGWYGQEDSAWVYKTFGIIHWNSYAHDCEVEGSITINSTTYTFTKTAQYRAYADSNWGENFPKGSPGIDYPWGWYYVGKPNSDISQDLSIIAGIGFHDAGFPFGTCQGQFADIRLNSTERIGVRQNEIWGDISFSFMETSNDGDAILYDVERDDWKWFTDELGSALIPLHQKVTIESYSYRIVLDYYSELTDYNRLLFPHEDYIFSDFEGLGVDVHVTITKRQIRYDWWDIFKTNPISFNELTLHDFWSDDGGIEYGYNLD